MYYNPRSCPRGTPSTYFSLGARRPGTFQFARNLEKTIRSDRFSFLRVAPVKRSYGMCAVTNAPPSSTSRFITPRRRRLNNKSAVAHRSNNARVYLVRSDGNSVDNYNIFKVSHNIITNTDPYPYCTKTLENNKTQKQTI